MRRFLLLLATFLLLTPRAVPAAGLSDSDAKNIFSLLDQAPRVVRALRKSVQTPQAGKPYFLYQLKDVEALKGPKVEAPLQVVDEVLTPNEPERVPAEEAVILFLGEVPDFTAYREWRRQGLEWRLLGGKSAVIPATDELTALLKNYGAAESGQRFKILLQALQGGSPRAAEDAALALGQAGKLSLSSEDGALLLGVARDGARSEAARLAAIQTLAQCGNAACVAALQAAAADPPSPSKWAALRALQSLGIAPPLDRLAAEFSGADDRGKAELLGLILTQKNSAAAEFASGVLAGPFDFEVKSAAVRKMTENKTAAYEGLLLKQMVQGEERLRVEVILALGKMGSAQAVPLVIPLLDNPSPALRGAAFFMLTGSSDPQAQEYMNRRYTRDHHGVWEQNQHFYGNTGPARPQ